MIAEVMQKDWRLLYKLKEQLYFAVKKLMTLVATAPWQQENSYSDLTMVIVPRTVCLCGGPLIMRRYTLLFSADLQTALVLISLF